jgi:polyhydroxybutyrate depolymerase
LALLTSGLAQACSLETDCITSNGAYRVSTPAGWDGRSAVSVALFFHGWQQSASDVMRDFALVEAFSRLGVLLVAVDGRGKTWSFPGSPMSLRDDIAFADEVLNDVERRYPVDRGLVWATGFSQGGSMTWALACLGGRRFTAFAPIAGAFWQPLPETCPSGPADIYHIHGTTDGTVPMAGRAIGTRFRQGDVQAGMAVWRRLNGCGSDATLAREGELVCTTPNACRGGRELRLCLHDGGHEFSPGWLPQAYAFVRRVAERKRLAPEPEPTAR